MSRFKLSILLLSMPTFLACPDPPPEIAQAVDEVDNTEAAQPNRGGPEGDPDSMDLSPGGTMLLDISQVVPQQTQEELKASGVALSTLSGTLKGSCEGGVIRIDLIEVGVSHADSGPMIGPVTALFPPSTGEYSIVAPTGRSYQIAALCDIDKDNRIVQDTDKLAPGIALGEVSEDRINVDLVFPGDDDTPVQVGDPNGGGVAPPGDNTASLPSSEAGARDRGEGAVPPPPSEAPAEVEDAEPPAEDAEAPTTAE